MLRHWPGMLAMALGAFALCAGVSGAEAGAEAAATTAGDASKLAGQLFWVAPIGAIAALIAAFFFYKNVMAADEGNATMREIAQAVREGAYAYLYRQYKVVSVVFIVLLLIFAVLAAMGVQNIFVPVAAMMFLHERVGPLRWAGIALIVLGIHFVSQTKHSRTPAERARQNV